MIWKDHGAYPEQEQLDLGQEHGQVLAHQGLQKTKVRNRSCQRWFGEFMEYIQNKHNLI